MPSLHGFIQNNKRLLSITTLPLIDGVFPTLVISGMFSTISGSIQAGLLIFSGAATITVLTNDYSLSDLREIFIINSAILFFALVEALFAPTIATMINTGQFKWFAAIALGLIALDMSDVSIPFRTHPLVPVGIGFVYSFDSFSGLQLISNYMILVHVMIAVLVSTIVSVIIIAFGERLEEILNVQQFRFSCAIALMSIGVSIIGLVPYYTGLFVVGFGVLLSIE